MALNSTEVRDAVVAFALRNDDLPTPTTGGIELDTGTGIHSGTPDSLQELTAHTITASGPGGADAKVIEVRIVRPGGVLAVQMPMSWDLPSHRRVRATLADGTALGSDALRAPYPERADGSTLYPFRRLFVVAARHA